MPLAGTAVILGGWERPLIRNAPSRADRRLCARSSLWVAHSAHFVDARSASSPLDGAPRHCRAEERASLDQNHLGLNAVADKRFTDRQA